MPQLDRIIIFPQIFWLVVIFTLTYAILTHFFLPKFVKSLKSRKQIVELNSQELLNLVSQIETRQFLVKQFLVKNLATIESSLSSEFLIQVNLTQPSTYKIDSKVGIAILNVSLYCDTNLCDRIFFYPKFLNSKFKSV